MVQLWYSYGTVMVQYKCVNELLWCYNSDKSFNGQEWDWQVVK